VLLHLPDAVPESETEKRRYEQAEERRKLRKHPVIVDEALRSFNETRSQSQSPLMCIDFVALRSSLELDKHSLSTSLSQQEATAVPSTSSNNNTSL